MRNAALRRELTDLKAADTVSIIKLKAQHTKDLNDEAFTLKDVRHDLEMEQKARKEMEMDLGIVRKTTEKLR